MITEGKTRQKEISREHPLVGDQKSLALLRKMESPVMNNTIIKGALVTDFRMKWLNEGLTG